MKHKRVQRIMREDNRLCLRRRKFVVATTDSRQDFRIYRNLARKMTLSGIDQLWTADITYIRLETEFVHLAVVLDAFSRKVIGWAVDRTLEASLPLAALKMALANRQFKPGLVHHSDRGVQYASNEYAGLLIEHGIQISMSRKAILTTRRRPRVVRRYEDPQVRGSLPPGIPGSGGGWQIAAALHRKNLQSEAPAFGARIPSAGRV
ncbi:MAG TPA: DDE-type integrase/transposase/recombinase [Bryobacteraceae bacterium]